MTNTIKVPQLPWHGTKDFNIKLPNTWQVEVCNMAGHDRPAMNDEQIKASITNLIASPPLRELAKNRKEVAIIFDDMHRPTRIAKIIPFIIEELTAAGIPDNKIRFIAALGNHAPMNRAEFAKKLGEATMSRFAVFNHNPFFNCTYIGTTSYGTKVSINSEVIHCDLKIAINAVTQHVGVVMSGGGKMIIPGVASMETTIENHNMHGANGPEDYKTNKMRLDMEEAAKLAGLDIVIECLVNTRGETVAIFAGAETEAHNAAVKEAMRHYITPKAENKDIVIANTFSKVGESATGIQTSVSLTKKGGSLVLIANSPDGQVVHYLAGKWGYTIGGKSTRLFKIPENMNHLIIFTEYPDIAGQMFFETNNPEKIEMINKWDGVIKTLKKYHGDHATVAIYPHADIVYFG